MKITFYEFIDIFSIIRFSFSKGEEKIYYFNISFFGKKLIDWLGGSRKIKQVSFCLGEMKTPSGEALYLKIYGNDLIELSNSMLEHHIRKDILLALFSKLFDESKIMTFFRKIINRNIHDIVIFINVISYYRNQMFGSYQGEIDFYIKNSIYNEALIEFARSEHLVTLRRSFSVGELLKFFYLALKSLYHLIVAFIRPFFNVLIRATNSQRGFITRNVMVSHLYTLKGFTFNSVDRCDFPWILKTDIPKDKILLYFEREDVPVTNQMVESLERQGIKYLAMSKGASVSSKVPVFMTTVYSSKIIFCSVLKLICKVFQNILKLRIESFFYLAEMAHFIRTYARASDFYYQYNIKINVDFLDTDPYRIARSLALDILGGVTISYQVSSWPISNLILGSGADIFFLFGPYYHKNFIKSKACNNTTIFSGFISDYSFIHVRERAQSLKEKLLNNGATFIVAYFDENSSDGRMSIIPNRRSATIYKNFLNWVIKDKSIGLICSPKRPITLLKRMPEISQLVKSATATGRCLFTEGNYAAKNYPTEVAQAADIVVSILLTGTTSLESHLSGSKVIYLDLEGLYSYQEYKKGKNRIVFDNFEDMYKAIDSFRKNPNSVVGFGDLSSLAKDKDPFKDGKAAFRMTQYIDWLYVCLKEGKDKNGAIDYANQYYQEAWGNENVQVKDVVVEKKEFAAV